jgi:hypothetical protein
VLLDEIAQILSTGGTTADGYEIHKSYLPEQPDKAVCIYETGGQGPIRAMRSSPGQPVAEQPRIQIVVRASAFDYATARLKINDVYKLLEGFGGQTVSGVRYLWIGAVQSPFPFRRDENSRPLLAVNFDVVKELSTA